MDVEVQPIGDAIGELADDELRRLVDAGDEVMLLAPGLMSWIEHLARREINRRIGLTFALHQTRAAIPAGERATSLDAASMLQTRLAQTPQARLFEALVDALGSKQEGGWR